MSSSFYREPNNDVVARITPTYAVRFKYNAGGAPNEFWLDGLPIITDPMLGEGVQVVYDTGQDSTQGSADGLTGFSIGNGYLTDALLPDNLTYVVNGNCPFFWLSHETIDDVVPSGPKTWLTPYNPKVGNQSWLGFASVGFTPTQGITESIFSPRDTLGSNDDSPLSRAIAPVRDGLGGIRTTVYLGRSTDGAAKGGVVFRGTPYPETTSPGIPSHQILCQLPTYRFLVDRNNWYVQERNGVIASGPLNSTEKSNVINNARGLTIEAKSLNNTSTMFLVNGRVVSTLYFPENKNSFWYGIYASCRSGRIDFDKREIIDLTVSFRAVYRIIQDSHLTMDITIASLTDEPIKLYRTNVGFFLHRDTFPVANRSTQVLRKAKRGIFSNTPATWEEFDGVIKLNEVDAVYAGSKAGEIGIKVIPLSATNDLQDALFNGDFHCLVSKMQINNSFVSMFNSIPFNDPKEVFESNFKIAVFNKK